MDSVKNYLFNVMKKKLELGPVFVHCSQQIIASSALGYSTGMKHLCCERKKRFVWVLYHSLTEGCRVDYMANNELTPHRVIKTFY